MEQKNSQINSYLFQVEKHLTDLSVADRARLILQIDTEMQANAANRSNFNAFKAYGPPAHLARKYRNKNGYDSMPSHSNKSRKWAVIAILLLALLFAGPILLGYYFISPLFQFNYAINQMDLDIAGLGFGNVTIKNSFTVSEPVTLSIQAPQGKIEVRWTDDDQFVRDCNFSGNTQVEFNDHPPAFHINVPQDIVSFQCQFQIPKNSTLLASIDKGQANLISPTGPTTLEIENGSINFAPNTGVTYQIKRINVDDGEITGSENLKNTSKSEGIPIDIKIKKGKMEIL